MIGPSNLLFIAEGQLGDLLLLTPAIRAVKQTYPHARVSVCVLERRSLHPLATQETLFQASKGRGPLSTNPHVDEIFAIKRNVLRSFRGVRRITRELKIVRFLRARRFDTVVCTFPEDRFALWAFLSGASRRVGQHNQPLRFLLTHTPEVEKSEAGVLEYYCSLVKAIGAKIISTDTEYYIPEDEGRWCDQFLASKGIDRKIVAIHPGATGDYKIWPPEAYATVINALQLRQGVQVILCHSEFDLPVVEDIKSKVKSAIISVNTGDDLGRLGAILQRCALCISNDSGPRHLAVAVGTPSLALFRLHHDREWKVYPETRLHFTLQSLTACPECPNGICLDKVPANTQFGSYCLRTISTDSVIEKAVEMLSVSGA